MTTAGPTYGRYEIRSELGWGGFAMVYRAWDPVLRREVALKALLPHLARDPDLRRRFPAEAQALARLQHTNIVPVYDVGEAEERPFFTMALVDGRTLFEVLASSQGLPLQQVIDILRSLASALDELHSSALVHRNLKPQNVMLDRSGRVVLMDLGIARALDSTTLTRTGATLGTPSYMAPEQVRGERVTAATDIYALGVFIYHLLAGRPPFLGDTPSVLHAQVYEPPPPLREIRPGLPEPVYIAVDAALAKDPARRPPSARRLVELLSEPLPPPTVLLHRSPPAAAARIETSAPAEPTPTDHTARAPAEPRMGAVLGSPLVTTLAGTGIQGFADGTGRTARFRLPEAVAVDGAGNVYVADTLNHCIRKVTPRGEVTTLAGSGLRGFADGPGVTAQFRGLVGIALDEAGNVYVTDNGNHRIRRITPDGNVTTVAGSGTRGFADGTGRTARLSGPTGIAVDAANNLYVADMGNHRIRKVTPQCDVTTLAGSGVRGFTDGPGAEARFHAPFGLVVDGAGTIYVSDYNGHRIRRITPDGSVTTIAGSGAQGFADGPGRTARFFHPAGIAIDSAGSVYVADTGNNRIRLVVPQSDVTTLAGSGLRGFADGPGVSAQFDAPVGLAMSRAGNIYVAELGNNRIRKITP